MLARALPTLSRAALVRFVASALVGHAVAVTIRDVEKVLVVCVVGVEEAALRRSLHALKERSHLVLLVFAGLIRGHHLEERPTLEDGRRILWLALEVSVEANKKAQAAITRKRGDDSCGR